MGGFFTLSMRYELGLVQGLAAREPLGWSEFEDSLLGMRLHSGDEVVKVFLGIDLERAFGEVPGLLL